jgi:hypothetical protein
VVAIVAVYALAIGFGVALFTGSIPGLGGHYSDITEIGGRPYYTDTVYLPEPTFGSNSTAPSPATFEGVTFWLWVTGWGMWTQTLVHGNGTAANGTTYAFLLGDPTFNSSHSTSFLAPGGEFGVWWDGNWFVDLYVAEGSTGPSSN